MSQSVAGRLIVLVAIPTMLGLALAGLQVTDAMRSAEAYGQVGRLAVLGQKVNGLAQAMENERADTAGFIAAGRPAAGLPALRRQDVVTDGWAATVRRLVRQLGHDAPARTRASEATVLASIAELPDLRRRAAQSQVPALDVINGYSAATAGLFPINDGIADPSGNPTLIGSVRALGSLSRMTDQASQQQAILGVALAQGRFAPGARTALITARAQQASDLASFRNSATAEESWALTDTLASPLAGQARAVEQRATAAGPGALALGAPARQQWGAGMSFTIGWMRHAEQQLAAWTTGYAQSLQQSALRSAMITGGVALAVLFVVLLATLFVARSLVRPLRRLEAAAALDVAEEARQRRSISAISTGFFRRSHSLLERLLRVIDSLELSEDDPGRLASLFQIDHLATRMRRNSDSALVLAGHEAPRPWAEPVILVDVLRAAVSEIEQYGRIVLDVQPDVSVSGSAVADTVHLLAELLENATEFSPKTTQVIVSGRPASGAGALISISDAGKGVPEDDLWQLNWQLGHPTPADVAVTRHMGLFAVAHLAARHGIKVELGLPSDGGTTAEVHLPAALISQNAEPDAVPLTLGAPLPPPAPVTSCDVTVPAPLGAGLGGALPIFESVESDYLQTRGRGLPRPSEPQADQPTAAAGTPTAGGPTAGTPTAGGPTAGTPTAGGPTSAGLPQRIPQASLVPAAESAQIARSRLASFQRGSRRARATARMDRDAKQPAQDD
jgi:signal transduction histidine kinase